MRGHRNASVSWRDEVVFSITEPALTHARALQLGNLKRSKQSFGSQHIYKCLQVFHWKDIMQLKMGILKDGNEGERPETRGFRNNKQAFHKAEVIDVDRHLNIYG